MSNLVQKWPKNKANFGERYFLQGSRTAESLSVADLAFLAHRELDLTRVRKVKPPLDSRDTQSVVVGGRQNLGTPPPSLGATRNAASTGS